MSKRGTFSIALSLALALAVLAPQAALGSRLLNEPSTAAGAAAGDANAHRADADEANADKASDTAESADADEQQPKRGGNAFVRALAAPFRALARLFGGGRKSKTVEAKKSAEPPAQKETATAVTQAVEPEAAKAAPADASPAQTPQQAEAAASVAPIGTPLAPAGEKAEATNAAAAETKAAPAAPAPASSGGARIIRPSAGEVVEEMRPKMWIPLIVGVPADPVSQGRALLQHGYIQEAIAELQIAATTGAPYELAEANNLLGLAYDRLGWHRQAAEAYERALVVSPKNHVVLTNLGYSLYLADDYAGALRRLNQAAKLAPSEPVIFNNLGVVHARLGHYGEAYKNFARASDEYEAHVKLAGILEDQKRDGEAAKHYEAALRLQPGASAVLERLVALYERTGARDKADTARRALGRPRNPQKTATGGGG